MLYFISGIFAMSLFSVISEFIAATVGIDAPKRIAIIAGPCEWVALAVIYGVIRPVNRIIKSCLYKSLVYNKQENKIYRCNSKDYFLFFHSNEKWERLKNTDFNHLWKLWNKKYSAVYHDGSHAVSMRFTPRAIWKDYEPVPKEVIKELKQIDSEK